jgi:hypothetical protein
MGVALQDAVDSVLDAAATIFQSDPTTRSVGVGKNGDGFAYVAIRNVRAPVAYAAKLGGNQLPSLPEKFRGIPIHYLNTTADPRSLSKVPHAGPAAPGVGSMVPEQQAHSPLVCGVQIQNFDDDVRTGEIANGLITIGTLGCFVELPNRDFAILSNNHVIAGENRGALKQDRILQPGAAKFNSHLHVATLDNYETLKVSPPGATVVAGTAVLNDIDAALAMLPKSQAWSQSYLQGRRATPPKGTAVATIGERVHKVGRTTGLTFGEVTQTNAIEQLIYGIGTCWFQNAIVIEGVNGTTFSDLGDSGSAIVRDSDGAVLGLLYGGNGFQTYACAIGAVTSALNCRLA